MSEARRGTGVITLDNIHSTEEASTGSAPSRGDASTRTLVELKRGATDAKGRLALAVLEATLERSGGG